MYHQSENKAQFRWSQWTRSELAQRKYETRQQSKHKSIRFTEPIQEFVELWLEEKYSPEQIVGVAKRLEHPCVSHELIYQHVWNDKKKGGSLHENLRTEGKRYRH